MRTFSSPHEAAFTATTRNDVRVSLPDPRFIVVHYHIFKNGGSTLLSILGREFPHQFATLHGARACSTLDRKDLASFLRKHSAVTAVSSHHLRYPKPVIRHTIIFDCCFLRDPLARLDSMYRYLRKDFISDPNAARARRLSPRDFFRHLIDEAPHLISNVQVTQLAVSGEFRRPSHAADLEIAIGYFRDASIPGLVEMFDESLVAAEYFLKPAFPNLRLQYTAQNVTRPPVAHALEKVPQRHEEFLKQWGADVYQDLVRLNQLDLELCKHAAAEVRRRFTLVPEAAQRLVDFKQRCVDLGSSAELSDELVRRSG